MIKKEVLFFVTTLLLLQGGVRHNEAKAQQLQASLSHYSMENGLISNAVADIKQDDYGYIWIATWNGLSRFDGFNFYNYETGNSSNVPLLHNRIIDVAIDASQDVWLRMYDGRIFVLNRNTDRIENPLSGITGYQNIKTSHPLKIISNGDVLAIMDGMGLYRMRLDRNGLSADLIPTGQLAATSIVEGYQNDLWVGTDKGIHRLNLADRSIDRDGIIPDEHINCMYSNGYNIYAGTRSGKIISFAYGQEPKIMKETGEPVSSIFVDSHNLLWFTLNSQGVSRMNTTTGEVKEFTQKVLVPEFDVHGAKMSEVNGTLWISMNHGGFGYYNRETDEVEYFHNDPSNTWNLSNTVSGFLALPEGVVWESTVRRGLEKLEIVKKTIDRKQLFAHADESNDNDIRAIYYDKQLKQLLIGNKNSCLVIIKDGKRTEISDDGQGNRLGRIYGINKGRNGDYWLCSKGTGLIRMSPAGNGKYKFTFFRHDSRDPMSLSSDNAYCSVEDNEGNVWVATYGGGVNILRKQKNGRYVFLNSKNAIRHYPYNEYQKVRTLAIDKKGNVWAGTTDGLLIMSYNRNRMRIRKVLSSTEIHNNLMSNDIVCLAAGADGSMWIGTNGGGLSHTTGTDNNGNWIFETFGAHNGLPSEEIKSITTDERKNVWFATDNTLCSFDTDKRIFSTFATLYGVDGTICSEDAAQTLPDGRILFGTVNGYYTVDRKKLTSTSGSMLKLKITDFYLDDELMSPRLNDKFAHYVPDSKSVELPKRGSVFAFRFASLNYQLQHRTHYQYMLEGYDKEWQNADKSRTASYANVPSGTYRFCVKAFLLESPDKYDMKVIEVIVPPFFLLSADAIWIHISLIVFIVATFICIHRRNIMRKASAPTAREGKGISPKTEATDSYELIDENVDNK